VKSPLTWRVDSGVVVPKESMALFTKLCVNSAWVPVMIRILSVLSPLVAPPDRCVVGPRHLFMRQHPSLRVGDLNLSPRKR
jgi:hypothetical protein